MDGTTTNGRDSRDPQIVKAGPARVMRRARKLNRLTRGGA